MRVAPGVVRAIGVPVVGALARSWRRVPVGENYHGALVGRPHVLLFWHEALLPLLWHHRGEEITIIVSQGRDGTSLAQLAERLGFRMIRGSSSRGGVWALRQAIAELRDGRAVAFATDGPRGPRRQVKGGAFLAAQRTGVPILPLHGAAESAWRARSWDRLLIPVPFARVEIRYGPPFVVPCGPASLSRAMALGETTLGALAA